MSTLNKIEAVKMMLKENKHLSIAELSRRTGLSRTVFYKWQNGTFKNLQIESVKKVADATNTKILINGDSVEIFNKEIEVKGSTNMDAQYIIDLQKDKIKQQEKELTLYKDFIDRQPLQKLQFDQIQEDMSSTVEVRNVFSLKPMERKMNIGKGAEKLEVLLGLPKGHNFFAMNEWHGFDSHPIDAIMAKDTLKELKAITKTLPSLFESLKFVVGNHYMSFPVVYEYKNNRVKTMCSILLDWTSSPKRILTKTVVLNGDNN